MKLASSTALVVSVGRSRGTSAVDRWASFSGAEVDQDDGAAVAAFGHAAPTSGVHIAGDFAIGCGTAAAAVAIRYLLPLPSSVLPSFTLVVAVCILTAIRGLWAGATAAVFGGLLTWRLIYTPGSWALSSQDQLGLLGYFTVSFVILATAELYRRAAKARGPNRSRRADDC